MENGVLELNIRNTFSKSQTVTYDVVFDGMVVGMCQFRKIPQKSNIMPEGFESHIYYEIDAAHQNKGYATVALNLLLNEAKKQNLTTVVLNVSDDNIPSQKVVEKNGGVVVDVQRTQEGDLTRKYVIKIS